MKKVGILGAGLMGAGIVQVAAASGHDVTLVDINDALIGKGLASIEKSLSRLAEKGTITAQQKNETAARIKAATDLDALTDSDLIIEAIIENLDIKRETFARLDHICKPETIFASNTSSLSITDILTATSADRQKRFVGMHFFNPVPMMRLVEVVRTIVTDEEVFKTVVETGRAFGKTVVTTADRSGFIVNRLLVPYLLDAIRAFEQGLASTVDVDNAMKLGCGHPMGPLTLSDFIGLDTIYYIADIMFNEFREQRFAPPSLLKRMVTAGLLGRKSGRGFYDYSDPANPKPMNLS
ncbi:MAG: 3-hydroxybutyryl-CoA dehydrogenase [Acidobacteriota bacterium]